MNCFKYLTLYPNLTIVGTYHGLNREDKIELHRIVDSVDYVAIEWDGIRDNPDWKDTHVHVQALNHPECVDNHLYLGMTDWVLYQKLVQKIETVNKSVANQTGRIFNPYDIDGNEYLYVKHLCNSQNKPCYPVDQPITMTFKRIITAFHRHRQGEKLDIYDLHERNNYMLRKLEEAVGPLKTSSLKGALLVGAAHIEPFYEEVVGYQI